MGLQRCSLLRNVGWKRYVQILRSAQDDTFASFVILSGALAESKDLYEPIAAYALPNPSLSLNRELIQNWLA